VTEIDFEAFSGCTALNAITLPDGLEQLGQDAFAGCNQLTAITWKGAAYEDMDQLLTAMEDKET
jgi:uncharacterized protein with PIN domain